MVVFKRSSLNRQTSAPLYGSPQKTRAHGYNNERQQPSWMSTSNTNQASSLSGIKVSLVAILLILPWMPYAVVRMSFNSVEHRVLSLFHQRRDAASAVYTVQDTIRRLEEQEQSMHDETKALFATLMDDGPLADSEEYQLAELLEEGMLHQIDNMHEFIQTKSRIANQQLYGRSPRQISFDLENDEDPFVVQLSDSRFMPHATHVFLDMVAEQLWEGHALIHRKDSTLGASKVKDSHFDKMKNPKKLIFVEQSDHVARGKHSICFSGTGPFFYISLDDDDSSIHDRDPCFGTVVENSGMLSRLPESTRIRKISVVSDEL